ncbi:MAG: N-acetylmuramoyl-L-alanine amidase [Victivallales bacterium]|jgi:N-acetylmuramoyl-L-alanine amidase CwlA|nr:N-acetylmuramoyl-L-alanine amidase [Victivallales bacterium]
MKYFFQFGILGALALVLALCGCRSLSQGKITAYRGLLIREDLLDDNSYNRKYKYGNAMPKVEYITIHNTANDASARVERAYLNRRRDNVHLSYHFAVDEKEAIQILPYDINGWHAGDGNGKGNRASIGVEICRSLCDGKDEQLYRRSEENGVKLAAYLLRRLKLPVSALRKHQDWSGKNCPHRILTEKRWESFKQRVRKAMQ